MDNTWTAMNLWEKCYLTSGLGSRYSFWVYTSLVVSLLAVSGCCDLLQDRSNRLLAARVLQADPAARIDKVHEIIRDSALKVLRNGQRGVIYNVALPLSLSGVTVKAVSIKAKELTKKGFTFKEFTIPADTVVNGQSHWIALVYINFGDFRLYYANRFIIETPVLGIKVYKYSSSVSSAGDGSELNLIAGSVSIKVRIPSSSLRTGVSPLCAAFDQIGQITISRLSSPPNVCTTNHVGDFSLVLPYSIPASQPSSAQPPKAQRPFSAPATAPMYSSASPALTSQGWPPTPPTALASSPLGTPATAQRPSPLSSALPPSPTPAKVPTIKQKHKSSKAWKVAVGASVGGIASFLFLSILLLFGIRYSKSKRIARMEYTSDWGAPLQTALIGNSRAPIAGGIRTRPSLET